LTDCGLERLLQTAQRLVEDFENEIGVLLVDAHRGREADGLPVQAAFA